MVIIHVSSIYPTEISLTGADEKIKAILDLLEDIDSPLLDAELYAKRKEILTEAVQDLCVSYRSIANEYGRLNLSANDFQVSESSSPLSIKNREVFRTRDLEATRSNPESTEDDTDIEREDTMIDLEQMKRVPDRSVHHDGSNIMLVENACSDRVKFKFSKLVEQNTQLQVELIRRNTEKRETIIKLQNQVRRLKAENDTLQRTLSFFDHSKQHIQENSPRRKALLLEKIFRGCSP